MKLALLTSAICCTLFAFTRPAPAQQPMVYTTTPLQANGDRFFESTNMSWSLRGPNFFATFGGPNIGIPRFGGYNPNAGISSGWAFNSGKFSGNFRFNFSQGYERFSTTTAPSLTTLDGHTGQFFSGVRRPFVYSLVPVVPPGGAFFSTPTPALHRQYRLPSSLVERVLRGDVILPESEVTTQHASQFVIAPDPHTARTNAAYAWFNDSSHEKPAKIQHQPTEGMTTQDVLKQPVNQTAENAAAQIARRMEPLKPKTGDALQNSDSNSDRVAKIYFQRGLDAKADKDFKKASFLFRMAAERASGPLRKRIEKQLESFPSQSP